MIDKSHEQTDKMLIGLEKVLKKQYLEKFLQIKSEIKDVVGEMDLSVAKTPIERYQLAQKYKRLNKLNENIPLMLNETNKLAVKEVNKSMFDVYKTNYTQGIEFLSVLLAMNVPNKYDLTNSEVNENIKEEKSPFDMLAVDDVRDITELRKVIRRQFVTAIMNGESPAQMVERIQKVTEAKLSDVVRIARTETTRIENKARLDAYQVGKDMGYKMVKRWVCVKDKKTRESHKHADGQTVEIDKPFIVDGEELMQPGDKNGSAGNVINCRCTMIAGISKK